ncbi:hypothetical protein ASA1KI_31480 [Opitutales bacterium ASA1]|uniref:hypothetical protein n=1 Tax=Congregicoccus parvus TaxID=3081749 RepID=UPI002B2E8D21|nr:hypothetical protein ASA1KI_31480 [Opitutales bacterium ASA1]
MRANLSLVIALNALGAVGAQTFSRTEAERAILEILTDTHAIQITDETLANPPPSMSKRVLRIAEAAGMTRSDLQQWLVEWTDEKFSASEAPVSDDPGTGLIVARGTLVVLGDLGDASTLPWLENLAGIVPANFASAVVRAAVRTAIREAPSELPGLVRSLTQRVGTGDAFLALGFVLHYGMPEEPGERRRLTALIVESIRGALDGNDYGIGIDIDRMLLEFDASFSNSDERRRLLRGLSQSANLVNRAYAEKALSEMAPSSESESSAADAGTGSREVPTPADLGGYRE